MQKTGATWPKKPSTYRISKGSIAGCIDHTVLKLETSDTHIEQLCEEAKKHSFFSVCVPLKFVPLAKKLLETSSVQVCTVIGFPFGYLPTKGKVDEARYACAAGAEELDMVVCVGDVHSEAFSAVFEDIQKVREACRNHCLKVILECSELTDTQMIQAAVLSVLAGADFVKTSTGFASGGAKLEDIRLLREVVGDVAAIKASGGIRDVSYLQACINAGADRIGSSSGVKILEQSMQS